MFGIKKIFPRSLFARSLIILVTPVLLVQVVTTLVFFDNHWSRVTARLSYAVAGEISLIVDALEAEGISSPESKRLLEVAKKDLGLQTSFEPGVLERQHVFRSIRVWEYAVAKTLVHELELQLNRNFSVDVNFNDKWVDVYVQLEEGVLHVRFPERRLFSSSGYIVLLWMLGVSVLLLLVAILFMRNQIRPIRKLAIAAERFGKGGELVSFKPTGAREVRRAAEAFIQMNKRIRRQVDQRTAMLAGVSHDLRTPLTRIKLQLEMLKPSDDIRAMKSDIADMERMIAGYLDFARGEGDEQTSFTNLSALTEKVVDVAQFQVEPIEVNIEDDVYLMLKPLAMERAVTNVIKNAQQYGQKVWVGLRIREDQYCEITVEDNGPGIPEHEYEDVFKPFFRSDKARDLEDGHVGLGLSIALDIVHAHGGKIDLGRSVHGGLKVVIDLPL